MTSLKDKVVLVTGGSSGIGAAIAIKLSTAGAKLAIVARNEENLKRVSDICERDGSKVLSIVADVTRDEDAQRIVSDTVNHYRKLDVLVNNVGIFDVVSILEPNAMNKFDHILTTNLRSAVHITHLAAPHLIQTKGNIINISSAGSLGIFLAENFPYCASKAGLDHFSRCVALELAPKGVRVNCINPGPVKTDFMAKATVSQEEQDEVLDKIKKSTALGKVADPEEIADVVLFLASDTAKSVTGSSYVIDNGLLLKGSS